MRDAMKAFREEARRLDRADPLKRFRRRFAVPRGTIYLDGNSLGLLSRDAERSLVKALRSWRVLAIRGWLEADPPWFTLAESLGARCAPLVGAESDEVVLSGTTTVNIHALVNTFYRPEGKRTKIVADELAFPTDAYALKSVLKLRGLDPAEHLVLIPSRDGLTLDEGEIVRHFARTTALVFLPSVLYRSGQLLDLEFLTARARESGIPIGFDCSHSVGAVPHAFDRWGVDFALWCSYKYLNGGPGATAFLYVNRKHHGKEPALAGWFGSAKQRQFDMSLDFTPAPDAGRWQISSPSILSAAPLVGSLGIFEEAGLAAVRAKSLRMTQFLIEMTDALLASEPCGFGVGTPREPARRGGHVALIHAEAMRIAEALRARGVVPDFRPPDIVRVAPVALTNTYGELCALVGHLREIVDRREYERFPAERRAIS
ncbi:MAG TPA: kynureninase [Candidatus Aminicenantes bacterium]|nr:kynureninase [Candidatus Aminicenantes bacterium]